MNVPTPAGLRPEAAEPVAVARAYEAYFASGAYDRRYPQANPTVLRLIRAELPVGGHVIDYGCGSGRYLLRLGERAAVAAGFDICSAALARFRAGIARQAPPGVVMALGPDPAALEEHVVWHGPADVVLCLFGVLSHIEGRAERRRTLERIAGLLRPGGRLILSVPNKRRRFRALQRALPGGGDEIRYVRRFADRAVELPYKLFAPGTLRAELAEAGFEVERLMAESLLPETAVARGRLARGIERVIAPLVPATLGYGLIAVARRAGGD